MAKKNSQYNIISCEKTKENGWLTDTAVNHPVLDNRCYLISFEFYKKKECELEGLQASPLRKAMKWFKDAGRCSSKDDLYSIGTCKPIKNINNYSFLYNGFDEDVEIKEYNLSKDNRLFFYIDEAKKIIYCILFKDSHIKY